MIRVGRMWWWVNEDRSVIFVWYFEHSCKCQRESEWWVRGVSETLWSATHRRGVIMGLLEPLDSSRQTVDVDSVTPEEWEAGSSSSPDTRSVWRQRTALHSSVCSKCSCTLVQVSHTKNLECSYTSTSVQCPMMLCTLIINPKAQTSLSAATLDFTVVIYALLDYIM